MLRLSTVSVTRGQPIVGTSARSGRTSGALVGGVLEVSTHIRTTMLDALRVIVVRAISTLMRRNATAAAIVYLPVPPLPEIIRLSCVIERMEQIFEHVLVHTGQNYDYELNEVFFRDLELRPPDSCLGIDASTLGRALGNILIESERVLTEVRPDAV